MVRKLFFIFFIIILFILACDTSFDTGNFTNQTTGATVGSGYKLPFWMESDEYFYNSTSQIMTDNNGLRFQQDTSGVIRINKNRYLGFAIRGKLPNENIITRTVFDYTWTWHMNETDGDYVFWAENDDVNQKWIQYYYFYEDPNKPMKIKHYIENNQVDLHDVELYYITNILEGDYIEVNKTRYNISEYIKNDTFIYKTGNFSARASSSINFNRKYDFSFRDIIEDGFDVQSIYLGNGSIINVPGQNLLAIGFTKNNGIFLNGQSVEIDPTFSSNTVGAVDVAVLGQDSYVVAWCDETEDDITYAVYHTDGTSLKSATDIDTDVGSCETTNVVSVDGFNSTAFVVGYKDDTDSDATWITIDYNTGTIAGPTDADVEVGTYGRCVDVVALNSTTFTIAWLDDGTTTEVMRFISYDVGGTPQHATQSASGDLSIINSYGCSVTALDNTNLAFLFPEEAGTTDDLEYSMWEIDGTPSETKAQTDLGEQLFGDADQHSEIAALSSSEWIIVHPSTNLDNFNVYSCDASGTCSGGNIDGGENNVFSGSVDMFNSTSYVVAFDGDGSPNADYVSIYNGTTDRTTHYEPTMGLVKALASKTPSSTTDLSLCENGIIYANSATVTVLQVSGGAVVTWDGVCSYVVDIIDPTTGDPNTTSGGTNITVIYNFTKSGVELTENVNTLNISIGGTLSTILTNQICIGTLTCSNYVTEASCNNCSQCTWASGQPSPYNDDTDSVCSTYWGSSCATLFGEADNTHDTCNTGTGDFDTHVDEVTVNATNVTVGDTIKVTCDNNGYSTADEYYIYVKEPDSTWNQIASGSGASGTYQRTGTFTTTQDGQHWSRCIVDYDGENDNCASTGSYRDNDDAPFFVQNTSSICNNDGSCGACPIGECGTNCSIGGCSIDNEKQEEYVSGTGWLVNVTVPDACSGTSDLTLFTNYTTDDVIGNDTQTGAIICGGGASSDLNWTIYNGTHYEDAASYLSKFRIQFAGVPDSTENEPTDQDASSNTCLFRVHNNGTATGNVQMSINTTLTDITIKADDDNTYAGATSLTTSAQTISASLASGNSIDICTWMDVSSSPDPEQFDFNITMVDS